MSGSFDAWLGERLQRIREADLYRVRRLVEGDHGSMIVADGRRCVNFCSNDYLGLAADPRVAEAAREALLRSGTGSGASPLVCGYNREHRELEEALAAFTGRPRALMFSTGWACNIGVLRALVGRADQIFADELNHASLIDGGRLSGARYQRVPHGDAAAAERLLADAPVDGAGLRLFVTDSVFSMDGDLAPLPELARSCRRHRAVLMIDDAHGFGVIGRQGRGAPAAFEPALAADDIPIYVATFGKALGAAGAFVAGSESLIEYLIQRARSWIFSTAPPPAIAAAARRALQIIEAEPERREQLAANIARFRDGARALGIPLSPSTTPIQPLIVGASDEALRLARAVQSQGYLVNAFRPPTVPVGTARLRVTIGATHSPAQLDGLLEVLAAAWRAQAGKGLGRDRESAG